VALLDLTSEMARARDGAAFSNGFEGQSWMNLWCEDGCRNHPDCPLLDVALLGRTPAQWVLRDPGGLNRYTCEQYSEALDEPS
jgi:hypothetical protein